MKSQLLEGYRILVCFFSLFASIFCGAQENVLQGKNGIQFIYDGPVSGKANVAVDLASSFLLVVQRSKEPLCGNVDNVGFGTVDMDCNVIQTGLKAFPRKVSILLGRSQFPDIDYKKHPSKQNPFHSTTEQNIDELLPKGSTYLALIVVPAGKTIRNPGPIIPKFMIEVPASFKLQGGADEESIMRNIFSLASVEKPEKLKTVFEWIWDFWNSRCNPMPVPANPTSQQVQERLENTLDPLRFNLAQDALDLAEDADPTSRIYLTRISGLFGQHGHMAPFFQACQMQGAKAEVSVLNSFGVYGGIGCLTWDEGLSLSKVVQPQLAYYVLRFSIHPNPYTKQQLVDLFKISKNLDLKTSVDIYFLLSNTLPYGMRTSYPKGYQPFCNGYGFRDESGFRSKWASYLGIKSDSTP